MLLNKILSVIVFTLTVKSQSLTKLILFLFSAIVFIEWITVKIVLLRYEVRRKAMRIWDILKRLVVLFILYLNMKS